MKKGELIVNEHGFWFDLEEEVLNLHESKFDKDGFWLNDSLLFSWEEIDEIRERVEGMG